MMMVIKTQKAHLFNIVFGFLGGAILSTSFLSLPVFATDSTIVLSTTGTSINTSPSASGTFTESSAPATISVTTDNYTGYTLTLESTSETNPSLVNSADASATIPSIPSAVSVSDFESDSSYNNTWGIKPSKLDSLDNSNYLPAPTTSGIILGQTTSANADTADIYNIDTAAKLDYETSSGSYSATLIARAVTNSITYSITYVDSSSSATGMPSAQFGIASDSTVLLSDAVPDRGLAYIFQGWCDGTVTDQDTTSPSCSGVIYLSSAAISLRATTGNKITLNAIWKLNNFTTSVTTDGTGYGSVSGSSITTIAGSAITISDNTVTINGNAIIATPATETAQYTYAFSGWTNNCGDTLSTDNCIITANFTRTARTYTVTFSVNTSGYGSVNRSSQTSVPYGSSVSVSGATATVNGTATTATAATTTAQYSYGFSSWSNGCGSSITGNCTITANFTRTTRTYTVTISRNNTSYGSISTTSLSKTYGSAITASGSTSTSISVGGTTVTATPASGYQFTNWTHNCGTTLTGACTITANFKIAITNFATAYAAAGKSKLNGYYKMQDMTSSICNSVPTPTSTTAEQTIQLIDSRDNKLYWVSKMLDGNCWMTQNLNYSVKSSDNVVALTSNGSATTWNSSYPPRATTATNVNSVAAAAPVTDTYSLDIGSDNYFPNGIDSFKTISCTSSSNGGENCHYQRGIYYEWNAAVAGTGGSIASGYEATASICPVGWRLPSGNTDKYSFEKLLNAYSISSDPEDATTKLISSPLWFVMGGYMASSGSFYNARIAANYWTSLAADTSSVYKIILSTTGNSSFKYLNITRKSFMSVRCVAV